MTEKDRYGLEGFLKEYPGMSLAPSRTTETVVQGELQFVAIYKDMAQIADAYKIKILIPPSFPRSIPRVIEIGKAIPRNGKYHVNGDDTLCLGSTLRLLLKISRRPDLTGFACNCIIPYLYEVSNKLKNGTPFSFELDHGEPGIIDDYRSLFKLKTKEQVVEAVGLLGRRKRIANKKLCPCGCKKKLGACRLHLRLNEFRTLAPRAWFKTHSSNLGKGM